MSYWEQLRTDTRRLRGAVNPAEGLLQFQLELDGGATRMVALRRDVVQPDLEMIAIDCPIGPAQQFDLQAVVAYVGTLLIGRLGYFQGSGGGALTLGTSIPTVLLDPNQLRMLLARVHMIAKAAALVEQQVARPRTM